LGFFICFRMSLRHDDDLSTIPPDFILDGRGLYLGGPEVSGGPLGLCRGHSVRYNV